ncbi:twin-arginine translocation signal domain-containing protein [Ferrovibrio sp.]|jgi:nitrous oxide reductase|uniref:twin-arginine translocation signal domain-containing protein n=1 Tax=Ferrovibrio sp. TaxID=1917215 RepID=UPI0035B2D237
MTATDKKDQMDRRNFLRTAGVGAAAAAVATAAIGPTKVEAAENAETRKKQRYKETDHVKRYYETNRL